MFKGKISEEKLLNKSFVYSLSGTLAYKYSTYRDSVPKIYLENKYSFDYIYTELFEKKSKLYSFGSKKDILISMCFNPYFEDFYERVKKNHQSISKRQKRMLYNGFLKHYSLESTMLLMHNEIDLVEKDIQKIYVDCKAYKRCNELITLFNI
jgi:hypothetical protein